ncbi:ribonuclease H-like domain-containing protein [Tanacetum coccineum]
MQTVRGDSVTSIKRRRRDLSSDGIRRFIAAHVLVPSQPNTRQWRDRNGNLLDFSVAKAWEAIRSHGNQVQWCQIVWFPYNIPRHAFHLWLVMRNGLKTHDRMRQWDVGPNGDLNGLQCTLCDTQPDSHSHLFFECSYSTKVCKYVRVLVDMDLVPPSMQDIILYLQIMGNKRTTRCIFGKLIMAATSYFIWSEHNNRTFKRGTGSPEEEAIENFTQGQKEWDNPPNIISEHKVANLRSQAKRLFGNENVWVEMHRGIAWDKVENPDTQSTPQFLPSFEKYTPPVTYPKEVEETLGTPIEVKPLDETQLEYLGLNTCNHDLPLSSRLYLMRRSLEVLKKFHWMILGGRFN